jgi:tetratricopeptide (TPR) repeat protein
VNDGSLDEVRARALDHVQAGRVEDAAQDFATMVEREPGVPDGWLNLATAERALSRLRAAAEHYRKGIDLLEEAGHEDTGLLATALCRFGETLEALELSEEAAVAYRRSARRDPRAPTPLAALSALLARAGHLREAGQVVTEYCLAAVSVLAEKANIGTMRRFQAALKDAASVDPHRLLIATREAYLQGFQETAAKLPQGARLEAEPLRRDQTGQGVPVLANPRRPFSRVRFDAIEPHTGERWMIQDAPTYGFPRDCPAAVGGLFSIPFPCAAPFPVLIATRTAWDYFFVRMRFVSGLSARAMEKAEELVGAWYLRGVSGGFGEGGRGFFHFLSEPFLIGDQGIRYEVDLGLAQLDAVPALLEALEKLHRQEPLERVMLGDGALPLRNIALEGGL